MINPDLQCCLIVVSSYRVSGGSLFDIEMYQIIIFFFLTGSLFVLSFDGTVASCEHSDTIVKTKIIVRWCSPLLNQEQ